MKAIILLAAMSLNGASPVFTQSTFGNLFSSTNIIETNGVHFEIIEAGRLTWGDKKPHVKLHAENTVYEMSFPGDNTPELVGNSIVKQSDMDNSANYYFGYLAAQEGEDFADTIIRFLKDLGKDYTVKMSGYDIRIGDVKYKDLLNPDYKSKMDYKHDRMSFDKSYLFHGIGHSDHLAYRSTVSASDRNVQNKIRANEQDGRWIERRYDSDVNEYSEIDISLRAIPNSNNFIVLAKESWEGRFSCTSYSIVHGVADCSWQYLPKSDAQWYSFNLKVTNQN